MGDTRPEPNETLAVNLFSPVNVGLSDEVSQGVIRNEGPTVNEVISETACGTGDTRARSPTHPRQSEPE